MGSAEHAPRGPFHLLERRDGVAEVVERGRLVVFVKRLRESFLILFVSLVRAPPPRSGPVGHDLTWGHESGALYSHGTGVFGAGTGSHTGER